MYSSNRKDAKQAQLYLIPLDGGEARPLSDLKGQFGRPVWSPDGRFLAFAFRKRDSEVIRVTNICERIIFLVTGEMVENVSNY